MQPKSLGGTSGRMFGKTMFPDICAEVRDTLQSGGADQIALRLENDQLVIVKWKGMREFATLSEAHDWFANVMDKLEYSDNERFAFMLDEAQMAEFERRAHDGCCGSYEEQVYVGGVKAIFGCNYGH